jgi:hypothetical protein
MKIDRNMKTVLIVSAVTGLAWSLLIVTLMGGSASDWARAYSFIIGGIIAGLVAGFHTIRSREKRFGKEGFVVGLLCYYLAMLVFWASSTVLERVGMCIAHQGWTDFELGEDLNMIGLYFIYGTIPWGLLLIPICFLNRWVVWNIFINTMKNEPNKAVEPRP